MLSAPSIARHLTVICLLALAIAAPLPALAEVYSLREDASPATLRRVLRAEVVLSEKIVVNGVDSEMDVAISDLSWARLLDEIQPLLANFTAMSNATSVVLQGQDGRGNQVRHLIANGDTGKKPTIFSMAIPARAADTDDRNLMRLWPDFAPQPANATVEQVTAMPKRGSIWLQYQSFGEPRQVLSAYHERLISAGWTSIAYDPRSSAACLSPDGKQMAVIAATGDADARTVRASVFFRRVSK